MVDCKVCGLLRHDHVVDKRGWRPGIILELIGLEKIPSNGIIHAALPTHTAGRKQIARALINTQTHRHQTGLARRQDTSFASAEVARVDPTAGQRANLERCPATGSDALWLPPVG